MIEAGSVIGGRYRLTRQVGEGGMATIWEAQHLTLGVPVAVKLMSVVGPHIAELTERFMNEARGAASVRHPNVIEIMDFGLFEGRTPYMVMELLEGESLADRLGRDGDVPAREAVYIVSLLLRGLAAVHEAGMVHRDIKPENIFLLEDVEEGVYPKLIDFGVSKGIGRSDLTHEGTLVGTPDYMSPEQARGRKGIDLRTDLYSVGVILYELLTGRLPFEADNLGDLIVKICGEEPTPLARLRPDLPPKLGEIVHKAMAKDRDARFTDARSMREALMEVAENFGFSASGSQLIRISEFNIEEEPVIPIEARARANRRSDRLDRTDTTELDVAVTLAAPDPTRPRHTPQALGALPAAPARLADSAVQPAPRPRRWLPWFVLMLALAGGAGVGAWQLGVDLPPPFALRTEAQPELPEWQPRSASLPEMALASTRAAEDDRLITLAVVAMPEGASLRIDSLRVPGAEVAVPARKRRYRIEVVDAAGAVTFRVDHPGQVDGSYEWFSMTSASGGGKKRGPAKGRGRGRGR